MTQVSGDADVCTGMFYARADDVSISVLRRAIGSPTSDGTDQGMVNYRLRTSHVPIKLLPCALFRTDTCSSTSDPKSQVAF